MTSSEIDSLVGDLHDVADGHLVVVTGAGISLASGIPTFRGDDPGAVWKESVTELGTYRFFRRDPVKSWQWSLEIFSRAEGAEPNEGHRALAELERRHVERGGRFTLVTQNIDTLHEEAGSEELVKVHGTVDRLRCGSDGCELGSPRGSIPREDVDFAAFREDPSEETLPRCPECGDLIRRHVLWFDEYYSDHEDYQWPRVREAAASADLYLFVGTSFSVGVTELFLQNAATRRKPAWSIDPKPVPTWMPLEAVEARAEEALPRLVERLEDEAQSSG